MAVAASGQSGPVVHFPAQRILGDRMIANWIGFGRVDGMWPSFQPGAPEALQLGADGVSFHVEITGAAEEHHCDFWDAAPGVN